MRNYKGSLGVAITGGLREEVAAWARVSVLVELYRRAGIEAAVERALPTKRSPKGLRLGQMVESLVLLSARGGDCMEDMERLFVQVLRLCREARLVKLGVVALDETKVAANAALEANRSYQTITEEVRRILAEARAVDEEEDVRYGPDRRGEELPEGLGRRVERLQEAKARLGGRSPRRRKLSRSIWCSVW